MTDDGRGAILAYVRENPGTPAWTVVSHGRGNLSRRQAARLVRQLADEQPPALRSDRRQGQDMLQARLWIASDAPAANMPSGAG